MKRLITTISILFLMLVITPNANALNLCIKETISADLKNQLIAAIKKHANENNCIPDENKCIETELHKKYDVALFDVFWKKCGTDKSHFVCIYHAETWRCN